MHPKCLVFMQMHAVKSTMPLIIKWMELHIYFFLLTMYTTRGTTWVHFGDSKPRTDTHPLSWAPRLLTEQKWNQYFSWVEAQWLRRNEGMLIAFSLFSMVHRSSCLFLQCGTAVGCQKQSSLTQKTPTFCILQTYKLWLSLLNHILGLGVLWSMQNIFAYMHTYAQPGRNFCFELDRFRKRN